ncbi:inner-membrane translocator [Brucella ceti TE28753-12]|nr:inner-membrane translocator [Brucella ceti TE28753-12]
MLMGAVSGFAVAQITGSAWLGLVAAVLVGALFAAVFGFLTLTLVTNQVATGLALTILASAYRHCLEKASSGFRACG